MQIRLLAKGSNYDGILKHANITFENEEQDYILELDTLEQIVDLVFYADNNLIVKQTPNYGEIEIEFVE